MTQATLEKPVCESCGAEVRPETEFCYNCGKVVTADTETPVAKPVDEPFADLEKALAASDGAGDNSRAKLDVAAAERRKARKGQRKPVTVVWDSPEGEFNKAFLLIAVVMLLIAVVIVLFTVYWK